MKKNLIVLIFFAAIFCEAMDEGLVKSGKTDKAHEVFEEEILINPCLHVPLKSLDQAVVKRWRLDYDTENPIWCSHITGYQEKCKSDKSFTNHPKLPPLPRALPKKLLQGKADGDVVSIFTADYKKLLRLRIQFRTPSHPFYY